MPRKRTTPKTKPVPPIRSSGHQLVADASETEVREPSLSFPVVGVGASAGGLEALKELLGALPIDTGMGFVLVQHLDPTHVSMLTDILGRATKIPVSEVEDQMPVEPNHVYVIPPGTVMVISHGVLQLWPRKELGAQHPIDTFFRSLADDLRHRSIGVILSGTATDGTLGCEEIKAVDGITFAQDDTAQHRSMPHSAVASGCVDFILSPQEIAQEIAEIGRHPYIKDDVVGKPEIKVRDDDLDPVLDLLHNGYAVDFHHYKRNTLLRRVTRRMVLAKEENLGNYSRHLATSPQELEALYQDILISVTSFFRNPETFEVLKTEILPRLTKDRSRHLPIRVWVLGCSTGEEAYSVAMALVEYLETSGQQFPVQVFASDLNGAGIEKARAGIYPKSAANDVSPERLRRFFVDVDGNYRISKSIRDMVVFARHNALTDPPFSHMDLVSCRNLLIYLDGVLQHRLIPVLHYSLRPDGFLMLGTSESVGGHGELFEAVDPKHKIYLRRPGPARIGAGTRAHSPEPSLRTPVSRLVREPAAGTVADSQREAERALLQRFAPPGVLINSDLDIISFRGDTGAYLAPASGKASLNLLKMLREGLLIPVRAAVQRAKRDDAPVGEENLRVKSNGGFRTVSIEVIPVKISSGKETCYLVLFKEPQAPVSSKQRVQTREASRLRLEKTQREEDRETVRLKHELAATREYLQSVIEQQEAANEQLQSANEEVQSSNEELQTINEELETSKEEIQSSNEELATVNDELHNRNLELSQSHNDLVNLIASVHMGIVMLGLDFRIRRFTPAAERLLNLVPTDVGRPIGDIKLYIDLPDLQTLLAQVIETVTPLQRDVQDKQGRWYSLRIRPYRTLDNKIDGAVIVLVDVEEAKQVEDILRTGEEQLQIVQEQAPLGIREIDLDGRFLKVNDRFCEITGYSRQELLRLSFQDITHPDDVDAQRQNFRRVIRGEIPAYRMEKRYLHRNGRIVWVEVQAGVVRDAAGMPRFGVGFETDITERKRIEQSLIEADRNRTQFLAMLAHELRNPLAPLRNVVHLLSGGGAQSPSFEALRTLMDRQIQILVRLIDDLLDASRITQGKLQLQLETVDLLELLQRTVDSMRPAIIARGQHLEVDLPKPPVYIEADPVRLEQIFINLLGNAQKFTPGGGRIRVAADLIKGADEPAVIRIRISDTGVGIAQEFLPTVFEAFAQADRRLDRATGGLGLGLTLVRSLVELHGGTVIASSEGIGRGSEFTIRLPVLYGAAAPAEPEPQRERRGKTRDARRILVVDDNVDAGDSLAMLLRKEGHEVEVSHDGVSAVEHAVAFRPEFVLLDIGLPGKDGYEVARELGQRNETGGATLIAVSGYGQDEDRRKALESGFDHYFTKPLNYNELRVLLRR